MPKISTTVEVDVDLDMLAQMFAGLNDESQTQFFVKVAAIAETWETRSSVQWNAVGAHLKDCGCSSEGARQMVEELADGMDLLQTK